MMDFITRTIAGPLGPYLVGAAGALALGVTVQTVRVDRLKDDVREAKAALLVPGTKVTWKTQAERAGRDLAQCSLELQGAGHAIQVQNAAVETMRAEGDRRAREVAEALQAAKKAASAATSAADRIGSAKLSSDDTCRRLLEIEAVITEQSR